MVAEKVSLDVENPEDVPRVLRRAAESYYESSQELSSAWQDETAGKIWEEIAEALEDAAEKIEGIL